MTRKDAVLLWSARILGIALTLFLAMFALDARDAGDSVLQSLAKYAIHLLPAAVVLAIVVLAWRRAWIGGLAFIGLAVAYAMMVNFRLDWVALISGPLLMIGVLFLLSWRARLHVAAH
jgi:hypothetical protein